MQIFNRTPPRIKPKVLRVARGRRLNAGLVHAWPLAEGGGTVAYDKAGLKDGTWSGTPDWAAGGLGGGANFTAASTQYIDCGTITELNSATTFTLMCWMWRSSASNYCEIQTGSSATNRVAIQMQTDGNIYWVLSNGGTHLGTVSSSATGRICLTMVYDGNQSTNATRLRGFIDGVPRTLSFTGTIAATTGTNGAAGLRIGQVQSATRYSTGRVDQVLIWDRALSDREVYTMFRQPLGYLRNTRTLLPVNSIPWTAYYSNLSPANLSTHQPHDGAVSIDWTPTDNGGNPITGTPTITGNGFTCDVTTSSLGGGALRCTAVIPAYARRTNTVTSTCTTTDSRVNSVTWTYTSSRAAISSDYFTDYMVPRIGSTDENVDFAVPRTGTLAATTETVEYAVQDAAAGMLNSVDNLTDYYAVDQVYAPLAPIGADIGTFGQNQIPIGVNVNATDHAILAPIGANVSGRDHTILAPIGADIAEQFYGPMAPIGVNVGTFGQSAIPIGAVISRALAEMHVELFFASEALQEIEDEP